MATDHERADAHLWGDEQTKAWREWDDAVSACLALGWRLGALTGRLLAANCAWGASRVADVDRLMYAPTNVLAGANKVTRACAAAQGWERAMVRSGLTGVIRELEHKGRTNHAVADAVAEQGDHVERTRDRLAAAALGLRSAYLVAVGGGARPLGGSTPLPGLGD